MKKSSYWSTRKIFFILFALAFLSSFYFKIGSLQNNTSVITMDQGRDLLDIRHMAVTYTPRLVGPTTSINGVLLGPFWYYFNLMPFIVSGGDPTAIAIWQVMWFQLSAVFIFFVLRKYDETFASISGILYLFLPIGFNTARYFWNANSMPLFTGVYFALFFWHILDSKTYKLFLLGLLSGIAVQIEAAFGIILFPFTFLYFLALSLLPVHNVSYGDVGGEVVRRNNLARVKYLGSLTIGFLITLVPQLLFEIRHGFIMTNTFLSEVTGASTNLGQKMAFSDRLIQRKELFIASLRDSNHIPGKILLVIVMILVINFIYQVTRRRISTPIIKLFLTLVLFLSFCFAFYLLFPQQLKVWYTLSLSVPMIILVAAMLHSLMVLKWKNIKIGLLFIYMFVLGTFIHTYSAQGEYLDNYVRSESGNPSLLRNQIQVMDWVYKNAGGKGFKVYSFVPSIYDFSYQYLFWWYGNKRYSYRPNEISYLPNQPEYIKDMTTFWENTRPLPPEEPTYLIIEKSDNLSLYLSWSGTFVMLCEKEKISFPFNIEVHRLEKCKK